MTCMHEIDVGAYVLDALEPEERLRVRAHLATCPDCRATLRELEGLPRVLALVAAPESQPRVLPEAPSELAFRRLAHRATAVRPAPRPVSVGHHPRRWVIAAAAAAVVGVAGGVGGVVASLGPAAPTAVSATSGAVHARAELTAADGGTTINLALDGVASGERCELVAVSRDGRRETASDWTATYEGTAHVIGAVKIKPQDIDRLVIRTPDGRTLLSMPS
jgi:anti-sigma-K factor RskA